MSRARNRAITQRDLDIWKLEEARHEFWLGNYARCSDLIFPLSRKYIQEPLKDTEEYKDGQRKPEAPVSQQQQEEEEERKSGPWEEWTIPANDSEIFCITKREERDDDGYLR